MNISTSIKQIESLLEVVLNTVSDGVILVDNDLNVKFQNKTLTQLYGSNISNLPDPNSYQPFSLCATGVCNIKFTDITKPWTLSK